MEETIILNENKKELTLATITERGLAVLFDFIFIIFLTFILFNIHKFLNPENYIISDEYRNIFFHSIKMFYVAGALYVLQGQTLGKKIMNIRIIDINYLNENDKNIKLSQIFIRLFGEFLTILTLFAGYFIILIRKDRRGFHDLMASTIVIKEPIKSKELF